jgi:hypothetical protein
VGQYAAEAFVASDRSLACLPERQRDDVVEALVIALVVIVLDVFTHDGSKMPLANGHDVTQALGLDRPDKTLGVGVQLRASRRGAPGSRLAPIRRTRNWNGAAGFGDLTAGAR